jgi:beta-glucosidase
VVNSPTLLSALLPLHPSHHIPSVPHTRTHVTSHITPSITGKIDGYSRNSGCNGECGRATFRWDNGPQGFGDGSPAGASTQWPSTLNMAASFDPSLANEWGEAMGMEFWAKGTNIQEGPGINIARIENNGRTFEYLSGEDPVLGGTLVQPLIEGIQQHVMSISKHYILNNQETDRSGVNEIVDEKTIMELYAPPFGKAAAKTAGYMCAYNRINGVWACENEHTLTTILKGYYNFSGFIVSDWGACHSTVDSINGGLDIEMPTGKHFNEDAIFAAIANKTVTVEQLHDSCLRIMSGWYNLPVDKRYPCDGGNCILNNVSTAAHKTLAHKIAAKSTVLVKNDGNLLPFDLAGEHTNLTYVCTTPVYFTLYTPSIRMYSRTYTYVHSLHMYTHHIYTLTRL